MTPRSRRRLRLALLLGFVPIAVAGLVLAVKLLALSPTAQGVVRAYDSGYFDIGVQRSESLFDTNWFEPWIAPYDRGTSYAAGGLYNEAIDDLEKAFDTAPEAKRCDVAVNLSLSWERLGDSYVQQGLYAGAQRLYETAQAVIDAAGEGCEPPNAPRNDELDRDPGQELSDAADRLAQKSEQSGQAQELQQEGDTPQDLGQKLDELGQQQQDAADEKAQQEGQERGQGGTGGFTDKPW